MALIAPWLLRTIRKEPRFLSARAGVAAVGEAGLGALQERIRDEPAVTVHPGGAVLSVAPRVTLLDALERAHVAIEAGCRMGVCGADPVDVVAGQEALSVMGSDEASTLSRLGLGGTARLACMARVNGDCAVSLNPTARSGAGRAAPPAVSVNPEVRRLVIVGAGIAGSTAADHARRLHPDCEIHVVGAEPHRLYNRMALSRLIHGRSAMQGLYLLPPDWYESNGVTCWLNTRVRTINREECYVKLATGEQLAYDRLVIATGSRSAVPEIDGIELPGSFTLRSAHDAIAIRAFAQDHAIDHAVVAGGGVLGVETAYALHKLGVHTTIAARGAWLMDRQLDAQSAHMLGRYLSAAGIGVLTGVEPSAVLGSRRVEGVRLTNGEQIDCGLVVSCVGVQPDIALARHAGLAVGRGIVVDESMATSDPRIFAAGDVAEFGGEIIGLWPESARQGEVAAINAVVGGAVYSPTAPVTLLKVTGIDVASIGRVDTDASLLISSPDDEDSYCRVFLAAERAVGAVVVDRPHDVATLREAVAQGHDAATITAAFNRDR